jgi:hypothetical protein
MREFTAYLLTLRAYGTWLHGDARGSVDKEHNAYKDPLIEARKSYENAMRPRDGRRSGEFQPRAKGLRCRGDRDSRTLPELAFSRACSSH